jgi:hypothetical protein
MVWFLDLSHMVFLFHSFISHCKEVYSLNDKEIEYVWNNYKKNI